MECAIQSHAHTERGQQMYTHLNIQICLNDLLVIQIWYTQKIAVTHAELEQVLKVFAISL
jgi:hypothetical protein